MLCFARLMRCAMVASGTRNAFPGPLRRRRDQRLLDGILGVGEVMEAANDHPKHLWRKFAQQMLGTGIQQPIAHCNSPEPLVMICRTSMGMLSRVPPGPGP